MKKNILVLSGRNGVGKDFFASVFEEYLKTKANAIEHPRVLKKITFGDAVKEHTLAAFPWLPREAVFDNLMKDVVYTHQRNPHCLTPRQMIHIVSDGLQKVDPYVFTGKSLEGFNVNPMSFAGHQYYVVTDMRIRREYAELLKLEQQGHSVIFVKIIDDDNDAPPKDQFEHWVNTFTNCDHVFLNKKDGPEPIVDFLKMIYAI